ncbi:MAG: hypothetical protein LBR00_02720, partial [Clostridiales Family XIII bacterium]|nr:hypothetical protein [Clostridiales Family XIII bacterium]
MWQLYDELIESIPAEAVADRIVCGYDTCFVGVATANGGDGYEGGICSTLGGTVRTTVFPDKREGMPL